MMAFKGVRVCANACVFVCLCSPYSFTARFLPIILYSILFYQLLLLLVFTCFYLKMIFQLPFHFRPCSNSNLSFHHHHHHLIEHRIYLFILDPEDRISVILKFCPIILNVYEQHLIQVLKKTNQQNQQSSNFIFLLFVKKQINKISFPYFFTLTFTFTFNVQINKNKPTKERITLVIFLVLLSLLLTNCSQGHF